MMLIRAGGRATPRLSFLIDGAAMAGEQQDLIKRADGLLDAFNAADWQRFAADLAPDVVYEETGTQRHVDGVDAYVQLCQGWKQAFPDAAARSVT
jgi:hypothetical protein